MAPTLLARYRNCNSYSYDYDCNYNSPWYDYGRWIVLAAVIVGAFLLFLLFACITARRRRRRGMQPFRGTGWAGGNVGPAPPYGGGAPYGGAPPQQYGQQGPPVYSPPPQQGYGYNQYGQGNQGYFGGQQTGVELQQPNNAYQPQRGGDSVYNPPAGPMPTKQ